LRSAVDVLMDPVFGSNLRKKHCLAIEVADERGARTHCRRDLIGQPLRLLRLQSYPISRCCAQWSNPRKAYRAGTPPRLAIRPGPRTGRNRRYWHTAPAPSMKPHLTDCVSSAP